MWEIFSPFYEVSKILHPNIIIIHNIYLHIKFMHGVLLDTS